jgi:hypothetical protein
MQSSCRYLAVNRNRLFCVQLDCIPAARASSIILLLCIVIGWLPWQLIGAEPAAKTPIDRVQEKPVRKDSLGSAFYKPSELETPFFKRLAKDEIATGGLVGEYDITKKSNTYVGWFGVVREMKEDPQTQRTTLLVEHKYFDGLTDSHIMAISFNGSGDFAVELAGTGHKIERLTLVKVYGKVAAPQADALPTITAEFVRNWSWGSFTFLMASGKQQGSEQWRKLNTVELDEIYDPYPDDKYYLERLGKR